MNGRVRTFTPLQAQEVAQAFQREGEEYEKLHPTPLVLRKEKFRHKPT